MNSVRRNLSKRSSLKRQQGVVLIVSLVMLSVLLIIVSALIQTSNVNFRIAANQQYRMEAKHANQNAIEVYISNPANFTVPIPTTSTSVEYELDGKPDNGPEYISVVSPPRCLRSTPLKITELNFDNSADAPCFGSGAMEKTGVIGASGATGGSGNSWCSRMMWDVKARVDDTVTGVDLTVHQGVYLRALIGTTCPSS